jgi:hypothetical protein
MSVLRTAFAATSTLGSRYAEFRKDADCALPACLMDRAAAARPEAACGLEQLRPSLTNQSRMRNPEVHRLLFKIPDDAASDAGTTLDKLRIHLGLGGVEDIREIDDGCHRFIDALGCIVRVRRQRRTMVRNGWYALAGSNIRTLVPIDGLFADLVPSRYYPRVFGFDDCRAEREDEAPGRSLIHVRVVNAVAFAEEPAEHIDVKVLLARLG